MKKTFYFSHDYHARNDGKMVKLLMHEGVAGIGIYWCIVEMLYEAGGYIDLSDCSRIAFELRVNESDILRIINENQLFTIDDTRFWSESILERLNLRDKRNDQAKESAKKRWGIDEKRTKANDMIVYVIRIYDETEEFIKVGITQESVSRRYSGKLNGYNYELLFSHDFAFDFALNMECEMLAKFKRYNPAKKFGGSLECLDISQINEIIDFAVNAKTLRNANKVKENKIKDNKVNTNSINLLEDAISKNIETHILSDFLKNCPNVSRLKKQMTTDQVEKLLMEFSRTEVESVLESMENYKDLQKKYSSVYLTAKRWLTLGRERQNTKTNGTATKPTYTDTLKTWFNGAGSHSV